MGGALADPLMLLGTSISGRSGETARRELAAQASLSALAASGHLVCVNLAFVNETPVAGPVEQFRALALDAPGVSGVAGPRKPVIPEMLDVLASEAERRGLRRFGIVNGDIIVTPDAVSRLAHVTLPAVAISRTDTGGARPEEPLLYGVDMIVFDVAFWRAERQRFRAYLLGEPVWDNVYAAIAVCHGGALLNRERLILHERHPSAVVNSPYARYVHLLAARDRSYFTRWCSYVAHAEALRARHGSIDEEYALQKAVFRPPGAGAQALDIGRAAWWRVRRALGV